MVLRYAWKRNFMSKIDQKMAKLCPNIFIESRANILLEKNKNNNFMFWNKKVMANQKTLLIPPKNFAFFHFYWGSKNLDKTALKLKNLERFFGTNLVTMSENFKAEKFKLSNFWFW